MEILGAIDNSLSIAHIIVPRLRVETSSIYYTSTLFNDYP